MATGKDTVVDLQEKGIEDVRDLEIVYKVFLNKLPDNLKRSGGQINIGGPIVAMTYFKFYANS